ncbi:MAG: bifunctional (p)ppGpp synthetase/guanosine-3',5'-bis(diphosphate) 3'-pyrophosphohydrolase [Rhodocyclales bacterium]|nr:bifunctional (p)ppGpp synthetase/guanosine-3',5'-bis(diphosphate) 3'-pyrophosphohydrolase [Rhodocyclales bacterium]
MTPVPPSPLPCASEPAYRVFLDSLDYLPTQEIDRIKAAYAYAAKAHAPQKRKSGEPYITHPLAVAGAVVEWRMDADAICAALLHDVMEDAGVSKAELAERFGKPVAELVDGLSKLDKMEFASYKEAQAENFRKMLMAMARDMRVVLIKLADRQHNIQTMSAMRADKRARIARETLEIYAPIALRLGLNKLYRELQDNSFRLIYPHRAEILAKALKSARGNRKELLSRIQTSIQDKLAHAGLKAEVFGREKSLYSIFRKMKEKRLSFSQVLDIYGFRVVVENKMTCYLALGTLHSLFKPVPGKFKDYIAIPKANGYQSLHTTLIGPYGTPVEVQIRTREMHNVAQEGVAAHWLYKDMDETSADLQIKTHKWLQSLLEMQTSDASEFFENVKIDLFPDEVYVFTPKGKILAMPSGATAVDFAYAVHTDVGNHCSAARINHELAPLRTELRNGDLVEIITSSQATPNPAWLTYVKTGRARSKIRHFLKTEQNVESARLGENLLRQELLSLGVVPISIPAQAWDQLVKASGQKSLEDVYTEIGLGKRLPSVVARRLLAREDISPDTPSNMTLAIHGTEGMAIQLARCCQPIPGDPIIGSIKKGSGLIIHTHDCPTIRKSRSTEPQKWIDVEWEPEEGKLFEIRIRIEIKNTRGALAQVASAIAEAGSNIEHVSMDADPERLFTVLHFTIQVAHRNHLAAVMRGLRHIHEVSRISRERGGED